MVEGDRFVADLFAEVVDVVGVSEQTDELDVVRRDDDQVVAQIKWRSTAYPAAIRSGVLVPRKISSNRKRCWRPSRFAVISERTDSASAR